MKRRTNIDDAIQLMQRNKDSVMSVSEASEHPYLMFKPNLRGDLIEFVDLYEKPERRQDMPPVYIINDAILMSWTDYLLENLKNKGLIVNLKNFNPLILSEFEGVDINTEIDFSFAEFLLKGKGIKY